MTDWMVHKEITTQVFIYVVDKVQNIGEIKDFGALDRLYVYSQNEKLLYSLC